MRLAYFENLKHFAKSSNAKILAWCSAIVVLWRLALEAINLLFVKISPDSLYSQNVSPVDRWSAWDGGWYRGIINEGYILNDGQQSNIAFFPAFPWLVQTVSSVLNTSPLVTGLVINVLLTIVLTFFVFKITSYIVNKTAKSVDASKAAKLAVILLLCFPASFFLAAFYAEALMLAAISGAIYFALKGRLLLASLFALVASSSKSLGAVITPVIILIDYLSNAKSVFDWKLLRKRISVYLAVILIGASGLIGYMLFLTVQFNDPLAFVHVQQYWDRGNSFSSLLNTYANTFNKDFFGGWFSYGVALSSMYLPLIALLSSAYVWKRFGIKYAWLTIMTLFTILIPLSTGSITSLNRYVYSLIPLFPFLSVLLISGDRARRVIAVSICLTGFAVCIVLCIGFLAFRPGRFAG